jgi:2-alkyl-3-oxoalkanoate reductase
LRVSGFSYPDTKVAAEATVLAAHSRGDIEAVIVRPGDVYGPESRPWVLEPLRIIRSRQAFLPRAGRGVFSPVYVDNLVDGIIAATMTPEASGRIYNLTDGVGVSCREYFGRLADMIGGKVRGIPVISAFALASVAGSVQRRFGGNSELCVASVHMLNRRGTYSINNARRDLDYQPRIDLEEGLARTKQWLESVGRI